MMDDELYFALRAEEEIQLAQSNPCAAAVRAHYLLAAHYLDLVFQKPEETAEAA